MLLYLTARDKIATAGTPFAIGIVLGEAGLVDVSKYRVRIAVANSYMSMDNIT